VSETHLTVAATLHQKHHPEDDRITGRSMLVKILRIKILRKIKVHLLIVY